MSPIELKQRLDNSEALFLLDVREDEEVAICQIENAVHIPMMLIPSHLDKLPRDIPIVVYCHLGIRAANVISYLSAQGFNNLINLDGGIDHWAASVDDKMVRY